MSTLEIIGFLTGLISVWLAVKASVWTWPTGILNSASWAVLFIGARLYTNVGLQFVYIVLAMLGWYWWLHGGDRRQELPMSRVSRNEALALVAISVVATGLFTVGEARLTDTDVPFWDALTTVLSLVATYLLTRKRFENWFVWISVDVIYVVLYVSRGLVLTASLQLVFIAMCLAGIREWRAALSAQSLAPEQVIA